ncbi:unnamed protein product [Aspergillus oryzae]|nr:unnamed protein product [Aspergillus oryzae]GMF88381.1 unnamed protein product [Aspergillus oryzae]
MEVAGVQQPSASNGDHAMDASMDIDMDLDLGPLPEDPMGGTIAFQDGAVDPQSSEAQYEKVHVRGVDELTTDNIKQFANEHFTLEAPSRVEWIDDTSANLIYSSPEIGLQALSALTQASEEEDTSELPALRLRSAKLLSSHPDSVLQVRSAVKTDRKKPRAHEASRFYLMHPEHDPRERLRREFDDRRRQGGGDDGDYRRRRFDGRELRRRRDRDGDEIISANMYDDSEAASTDYSETARGRDERGRRRHRDRELFPSEEGRPSGRLQNRSASPGRDTLVESGYSEQDRRDSRRHFRERSPQIDRRNKGKELFPSSKPSGPDADESSRELFPNKPATSYLKKELFPSKHSNHRRSDAIDAADETADLFSKRISVPIVDGSRDQRRNKNVELFPDSEEKGVNIRGAAGPDQGFSIRGAANGLSIKGRGASVRELFPSKYKSNAGKELFSEKIEGRGGNEDNQDTSSRLITTGADKQLHLFKTEPNNALLSSLPGLSESPILSYVSIRNGEYVCLTNMSGQLLLQRDAEILDKRKDHAKYAVKVVAFEDTDLPQRPIWIATAGWDSKIHLYRLRLPEVEGAEADLDSDSVAIGEPIASIALASNPESLLFVQHPDTKELLLLVSRRDSTHLYYYQVPQQQQQHQEQPSTPYECPLLGKQNLAPHSNAWIAFSPSCLALSPHDPGLLAVATSTLPHMKVIIVRLLFPSTDSLLDAREPETQATQALAALSLQNREDAAIVIQANTFAPQTAYSTPQVVWRPDGSGVWVNGDDGVIRGVEGRTGKVVTVLKEGHVVGSKIRTIWAGWVDVGRDGDVVREEWLVSGGFDKRLVVWRA